MCRIPALGFTFSILLLAGVSPPAAAQSPAGPVPAELLEFQVFRDGHPDLRWRYDAARHLSRGNHGQALKSFQRAAEFADKPSQAAVSEMLWAGMGVRQDRPLAYAWMDLAAERGYPAFLVKREAIWGELDAGERAQALALGAEVYAEYGDEVAKPRMNRALRRAMMNQVGSRVGADVQGNRRLMTGFPVASKVTGASFNDGDLARVDTKGTAHYYDERYWHPESYWRMQDDYWRESRSGEVLVHPLIDESTSPER